MAKAIRFTKDEMAAVQWAEAMLANVMRGETVILKPRDLANLHSLHTKMVAASDPAPVAPLRVNARDFVATVQRVMGPRVVVVDSPATYIKLTAALRSEPFASLADVEELATSVLAWANQPMNVHTLVQKGPEWLAMHRARKEASKAVAPPPRRLMWDDED
jgi:hypothetical protein